MDGVAHSVAMKQLKSSPNIFKRSEMLRESEKFTDLARQRALQINAFLRSVSKPDKSNNKIHSISEKMVSFASKQGDLRLFVGLLRIYIANPRWYSLSMNVKFLQKIRALFSHPNNSYTLLALNFLETVIDVFGEDLRNFDPEASYYSLSTEEQERAERRHDACMRCRAALLEIRLNAPFLIARLSDDAHKLSFHELLARIDIIIETN